MISDIRILYMMRVKNIILFLVNLLICLAGLGFFVWLAVGLEKSDSTAYRFFGAFLQNKWKVIGGLTAAGLLLCLPVLFWKRR